MRLAVMLLLATVASVVVVCAPDLVGVPARPAAATVPPEPDHPRACPGQTITSGDEAVTGARHVRFYVPAGKQLSFTMEVFLQAPDPDGVWREHFRVEQTNSGPSPAFLIDRVRDGSQLPPKGTDWFRGDSLEFSTGGWLDLSISEVDGRPIKFWMQLGNGTATAPDCAPRAASEDHDPNCLRCPNDVVVADPINTRTGNLHMPLPGLAVGGRGPGLSFGLAYNSLEAGSNGKTGFGWSSTLGMRLDGSGTTRTVVQEGGSTVPFTLVAGAWVAPVRFRASLVQNGDGSFTFERNHFTRFRFSSSGRLEKISDRNGNETTLSYPDGTSTQASYMQDPAGRRLVFAWSSGRLASVTDQLPSSEGGPRSLTFGYSGAGDLVSYGDEAGKTWSMGYDSSHRMVSFRSPRFASSPAKAVENHYVGTTGKVDWQENELNERTTLSYTNPAPPWNLATTTVTDPVGNVSVYKYSDGRLMAKTVGAGTASETTTRYERDALTDVATTVTDGRGKVWRYSYDDSGNRLSAEDPLGRIARWEYNALEQVTKASYGELRTSATTSSTASQVTSTWTYDTSGNPLTATTAQGTSVQAVTQYVHGTSSHPEDVTSVIDPRNKTWSATYAASTGDLTAVTDPLGFKTTYAYNAVGWINSSVTPKGNGTGGTPANYQTVVARNLRGQPTQITDPLGNITRATYDDDGNVHTIETHLSASDSTPQTTTYGYDDADRLTSEDAPGTGSRGTEYDANGQVRTQIDELGARTEYTYDAVGRLATEKDPDNHVTSYGYDQTSNLVSVVQPGPGSTCTGTRVNCISYSYDDAGQQTSIDYSNAATPDVTGITYDPLGRVTDETASGHTETWSWDAQDRLTAHLDNNNRSTGYGWDAAGNLISITYPGTGKVVNRTFDDAGHLKSVTDWASRTTTFDYDPNANWTQTNFPAASTNTDLNTYDRADQLVSSTWKRGSTTLGSLSYGARDPNGLVTSVAAAGAGTENNTWGYDDRNQLRTTATEAFDYDPASNLTNADGVHQVFDAAQRLCWTSPTATSGTCATPSTDATMYQFDPRGNRTTKELPSGTATSYGFDQANRLTSADIPTVYDPESRQFQLLAGGAARVADGAQGTGSCNGSACAPFTASTTYNVDIAGQGGVPATGVTAVTGMVTVTNPDGDGWLTVNAAGDAAAATVPLQGGEMATASFTAALDSNGGIQIETDVDATVAVDITGYWTPPPAWVPALNYWPVTPEIVAASTTGEGTCDGDPCGTLPAGTTEVTVAGVGGVPATGVSAVSVSVVATGTTSGQLRVAPNGDASAGDISWDSTFAYASGTFTVPIKSNGTIEIEVANATDIRLSVTGYWKLPTNNDTGLGLTVLEAPERLVDTRDGTGTCDGDPCDHIPALTDITIDVAGQAGVPEDADAVMVAVNVVDPTSAGILAVGANPAEGAVPIVFAAGEDAQASFITGLAEDGTINVTSWAATDLTIDVIGYFELPTFNYTYSYDATGLRSAKTYEGGPSEGGWTNEYTWDRSGGLPMLLAEHTAAGTSYMVYGPGNTPIYQVTTSGDVMYYHQDHLGSTRLTTNANGTSRGVLTYDAYGETKSNTNPWFLEQPLLTFAGEQRDAETGFVYLRARYLDPATGQFMSVDPLAVSTGEQYSYAGLNPTNYMDPSGLCWKYNLVCQAAEGGERLVDIGKCKVASAWAQHGDGACTSETEEALLQTAAEIPPDYVSVDSGGLGAPWGFSATITKDGRVYFGSGPSSPGADIRVGYLDSMCDTEADRSAAANGGTTTGSWTFPGGLSVAESYVWPGWATEVGIGTNPGPGGSHSHSHYIVDIFPWW